MNYSDARAGAVSGNDDVVETRRIGLGRAGALLRRGRHLALSLVGIVLVFILWITLIDVAHVPGFILPAPADVVATFVTDYPRLIGHTEYTATVVISGYLLAILVAVPIAVLLAFSPVISTAAYPVIVATQSVPKVALAPLALIWLGFGPRIGILVTVLICFFPIIINTVLGLKSLPIELVYLAQSMGAGKLRTFLKIRVPYALPYFFGGLKVAITLAVVGAVVGEFVGSNQGLGYYLLVTSANVDTAAVFADLILLSVLAMGLFGLVQAIETIVMPRPRSIQH